MDRLPLPQKRFPLFEDIFRRSAPQPGMTPLQPGVGGVPRPLYGDAVAPPVPANNSLFSPEDIHNARAEAALQFGSALLGGSGKGRPLGSTSFPAALGAATAAGGAGYDAGLKSAFGARNAQQTAELRARIMAKYPEFPKESTPQTMQRLEKIFAALSAAGEFEGAGKIGEVLKSYESRANLQPKDVLHIDLGDRTEVINPATGQTIRVIPKGLTPKTPAEVSAEQKYTSDQTNKIRDDFREETKKIDDVMSGRDIVVAAIKNPGSLATPFALTDAYARVANPGGVVRPTTQEMIEAAGSVGQRMRKYWEKNVNGSLPPDILRDYAKFINDIVAQHMKHYTQVRSKALVRAKLSKLNPDDLDKILTSYAPEDLVGLMGNVGAPASTPGAIHPIFTPPNGLFPNR